MLTDTLQVEKIIYWQRLVSVHQSHNRRLKLSSSPLCSFDIFIATHTRMECQIGLGLVDATCLSFNFLGYNFYFTVKIFYFFSVVYPWYSKIRRKKMSHLCYGKVEFCISTCHSKRINFKLVHVHRR